MDDQDVAGEIASERRKVTAGAAPNRETFAQEAGSVKAAVRSERIAGARTAAEAPPKLPPQEMRELLDVALAGLIAPAGSSKPLAADDASRAIRARWAQRA